MVPRIVVMGLAVTLATDPGRLPAEDARDVSKASLPEGLLTPRAAVRVAMRVSFLEGPAFDAAGNHDFGDVIGNRILKVSSRRPQWR